MPEARRFAIVSPNFYPQVCGVGDHSARLGGELRRRGHEVAVFSRTPVKRHPEEGDLEVHGVPGPVPLVIARGMAAAIAGRHPTDVIIQYTSQMWDAWRFGTPALVLLATRARQAGARVILIVHEPFVPWARRPDLFLAALIQRGQFAALLACCDQVFVTTGNRVALIAPYCRVLGRPLPEIIRVGANALPAPRGEPSEARSTDGMPRPPRIGVFSTAAVGKRFDVVLDAFTRIASELPSAELVLIGDLGPPERAAVKEIAEAIHRHEARGRIHVTGKLSLSEIAREVASLDVYLFPMSTGANTRSGTLPVALGSALPVVAISGAETDAALFREDDNIVFAREFSGAAFADAALRVLRDRSLRLRVAAGAQRLYAEHLTWPRIVDQLLSAA